MDVSIIIVNYNTLELTRNCLKSIYEKTKDIEFEVIVSDNGSNDGSVEMIKNQFPQVILIENNTNLGFGKANNIGYQHAKGQYIFLLNSDTVLLNNAAKLFADEIQKLPDNIACLGCKLRGADGEYIHSYGNFPTFWNEMFRKPLHFLVRLNLADEGFDSKPAVPINNNVSQVEYVTGADLFIKRSAIDSCGFFDNKFFMYYEDTELQYRYRQNGFFSCLYDSPKIMHIEKGSSNHSIGKDINGLMVCYETIYGKRRKRIFQALFFILSIPGMLIDFRFPIKERLLYLRRIIQG